MIVLSDEFYREILNHPIPIDLEGAKALSSSPAALDLFMWLSYRCFTAQPPFYWASFQLIGNGAGTLTQDHPSTAQKTMDRETPATMRIRNR